MAEGSKRCRGATARPGCPLRTVTASPPTPVSCALHERRASEPWLLHCMRSAGCWLHSASAALRHCGFQPHCRLSACSARWRGSRYRLRCAHQRRRSACRALTAQRGRVPGGLASPRASWSMRSRSGQASRRRRPSWCSVQVQPACTARVACTHATEPAELVCTWPVCTALDCEARVPSCPTRAPRVAHLRARQRWTSLLRRSQTATRSRW